MGWIHNACDVTRDETAWMLGNGKIKRAGIYIKDTGLLLGTFTLKCYSPEQFANELAKLHVSNSREKFSPYSLKTYRSSNMLNSLKATRHNYVKVIDLDSINLSNANNLNRTIVAIQSNGIPETVNQLKASVQGFDQAMAIADAMQSVTQNDDHKPELVIKINGRSYTIDPKRDESYATILRKNFTNAKATDLSHCLRADGFVFSQQTNAFIINDYNYQRFMKIVEDSKPARISAIDISALSNINFEDFQRRISMMALTVNKQILFKLPQRSQGEPMDDFLMRYERLEQFLQGALGSTTLSVKPIGTMRDFQEIAFERPDFIRAKMPKLAEKIGLVPVGYAASRARPIPAPPIHDDEDKSVGDTSTRKKDVDVEDTNDIGTVDDSPKSTLIERLRSWWGARPKVATNTNIDSEKTFEFGKDAEALLAIYKDALKEDDYTVRARLNRLYDTSGSISEFVSAILNDLRKLDIIKEEISLPFISRELMDHFFALGESELPFTSTREALPFFQSIVDHITELEGTIPESDLNDLSDDIAPDDTDESNGLLLSRMRTGLQSLASPLSWLGKLVSKSAEKKDLSNSEEEIEITLNLPPFLLNEFKEDYQAKLGEKGNLFVHLQNIANTADSAEKFISWLIYDMQNKGILEPDFNVDISTMPEAFRATFSTIKAKPEMRDFDVFLRFIIDPSYKD